ncbi:bacteriocin fulvocin C-related protein [Corallococcus sp. M34]|uniref:bacteriocin fulvocin C-related protein n=1 Tax=Citreicoccus inhibens TaxID=2849499 RepID=UPI001C2437E7|nr:bacteriocin fulvocin C-related protein [Citreicoccus inhibens]MBU8899115.1 bacteriocin fulvocin C-related protein [Citreicoccus inhibens]
MRHLGTLAIRGTAFLLGLVCLLPETAAADEECRGGNTEFVSWLVKNSANVPTDLRGLSTHPVLYREAAFQVLSPAQQAALWREHVQAYRRDHPRLTLKQLAVLDAILAVLTPDVFEPASAVDTSQVEAAVVEAFGTQESQALIRTLGPPDTDPGLSLTTANLCKCSLQSAFCSLGKCQPGKCHRQSSGCGSWWRYPCDGVCK